MTDIDRKGALIASAYVRRGRICSGRGTITLDRLIDGRSFTPEALKVVYKAFDLAWAEIASRYGDDLARMEFARTTLAQTILSVAGSDPRDPYLVKTTALASFSRFNFD